MKKEAAKMSNAIFLVTTENFCPLYDVGDELKIENSSLSISSFKPVCLYLSEEIKKVVSEQENTSRLTSVNSRHILPSNRQAQFNCGGCNSNSLVQYKFKQDKEYATLQMKLLMESEEVRKQQHLAKYFNLIRPLKIFKSLEDDALNDLTIFLEFKTVPPHKLILEKGSPGTHLYIIISGEIDLVEGNGQKTSKIYSGDIFGEISLLSGEPHISSFHTVTVTQVALLSIKNFRQILKKHPTLQIFLFKLLIDQVQAMALRSGNIASGMTGDLEDVPAVDLMQLINSSQKTGNVELMCVDGSAQVLFKEGEIVHAHYKQLVGKEAFYAILGIKKGQFTYNRGIVDEFKKAPPIGGFIGMVMEGVQRIDEHSQQ